MELVMKKDLETQIPQELAFNYEELKAELQERLEYYNNLVVTEDTIKQGKEERAALNKFKGAIDTYRKDVKKRYLAPYNVFEKQVKDLTGLIDEPIHAIDNQLAVFEDQRKQAKQSDIETAYDKLVPDDLREIIPLDRIQDKKWLNATTSMKKVEEDIAERIKRTEADLLALDTVPDEYKAGVHAKYLDTLDIQMAMNHMHAQQKAEEAFKARQEEEKRRLEEQAQAEKNLAELAQQEANKRHAAQEEKLEEIEFPDPAEKKYPLCLAFNLTKQQAIDLKNFLYDNNIEYHRIARNI